jgi:hypothetical protein
MALFLADAAIAQTQVVHHGLSFPARVGGFGRGSSHEFEKTRPGLGYSVKYSRRPWYADIYIYDLGRRSIPDDPQSALVKAQFEQARGDILAAQKSGRYQNVTLVSAYAISDANGRQRFNCGKFTLTRDKSENDSYLCVTSWRNKFVKFRISVPAKNGNDRLARSFIESWVAVLWPLRP